MRATSAVFRGRGSLLLAQASHEPVLRRWLEEHGSLMAAAEADPAAVPLAGRGRVAAVPVPGEPEQGCWVVRHYHRGGAVASALGDRYLRVGAPRPFREVQLLDAVRARGVPAPVPVGAAVYPAGPFYRGDLVTCWVAHSLDLATLLFQREPTSRAPGARVGERPIVSEDPGSGAEPLMDEASRASVGRAAMGAAGRLVRLLHRRGIEHKDLNLKNILLSFAVIGSERGTGHDPRAMILDLDRARLHAAAVPERIRRKMLTRFWRSARKWERRTGLSLDPSWVAAFEAGYEASTDVT